MIRRILAAAALPFYLTLTTPVYAQVEELVLRVDGMSCPMCAGNLTSKFGDEEGVLEPDIDWKSGDVIIDWDPGLPLDLSALYAAVKKAGMTVGAARGTFAGMLERDDEAYYLVLPVEEEQRLRLFEPSLHDGEDEEEELVLGDVADVISVSEEMLEKLDGLLAEGIIVRVSGPLLRQGEDGAKLALGIEAIEEAEE